MSVSRVTVSRPSGGTIGRWAVLLVAAVYFFGPLLAAISFTVTSATGGITFAAYANIFASPGNNQPSILDALVFSLGITLAMIVLVLGLMVPTQILLHLYAPKFKPLVEVICLLPLVFPPVVLVVGVELIYKSTAPADPNHLDALQHALVWVRDAQHPLLLVALYAVMALPFVYRSLDAGIEGANLRTLTEASRNLGASWWTTITRVLLPTLRTSMINAGFLCSALAMGEYTVAGILGYTKPFPVWLAQLHVSGPQQGQEQAAISVFSLLLVEVALLVVSVLTSRQTKKGQA